MSDQLLGLMQDWPLTVNRFLDHANRWHARQEIVARRADGQVERTDYARLHAMASRVANALRACGTRPSDRIATMAMNGIGHVATWYGISGIGAVCHTLNPRLFIDQLVYIVDHAEDRLIFADGAFVPILEDLIKRCPKVERVILLSDTDAGKTLDDRFIAFEHFIDGHGDEEAWDAIDEKWAAGLCYTSGTTGDPKGVLYSHRSNFLHAVMSLQPDVLGLSALDVVLPIVPMYHANGWGLPFSAPAVGAKMVLPGARLDGVSLTELIDAEQVTFAAGVPTVAQLLLDEFRSRGGAPASLKRFLVGGAALSERTLQDFANFGVAAIHSWGMTEMSPIGGISMPTSAVAAMPEQEQLSYRLKQGRTNCGVDMRIVDQHGEILPHDGTSVGSLQVRGPGVVKRYFGRSLDAALPDGFFDTGDLATIDHEGFMKIVDRSKDIIKSGGEWISSQELENTTLLHPKAQMAAVIGVPHPKWDERPALFVKLKEGCQSTEAEFRSHLERRIAKWWMPDWIVFVEDMPLGGTGKIDKKQMRSDLPQYLPGVESAGH